MKKLMDRMTDELRENHGTKKREEAGTTEGPMLKLKGKLEDTETTAESGGSNAGRSKYKKLEMLLFTGVNPESWAYRAEHFFDINNLSEAEKVKVAVVSFGQEEVD